ncbi:hypothetical protein IQ06DRAFT_375180 [Phaeosphaeriaceae sp. SRC1lsM3a]|nr:hypothetical protein IQ06DRAFT_375180 [Stagonospora sp. SRC1lsM3a]
MSDPFTPSDSLTSIRKAHGILISITIVLWFPFGVFLLRLLKVTHTVRWHAIWQGVGLLMTIVGFGSGRYLAEEIPDRANEPHVLLGTVIAVLFLLMPILGWLHHRQFVKHGITNWKSAVHKWGGRVLLLLGVVNGFTGLQLSGEKMEAYVGLGVLAAVILLVYLGIIWWKGRRMEVVDEMEMQAGQGSGK